MSLKQNIEKVIREEQGFPVTEFYTSKIADKILTLIQKEREEVINKLDKLEGVACCLPIRTLDYEKISVGISKIKQTLTGGE